MRLFSLALLLLSPMAWAQDPPERVTLTLSEFLKLYEATKNRPDKPEKAPREFALSAAAYDGRVVFDGDEPIAATFNAKFTVEVLKPGWARVPLLDASVAVQSAKIGGADAPLVLENGAYTLVTDRQGRFDVDVVLATSVTTQRGSSGFSFPLQPSGATTVKLEVAAEDALDFTVANAKLKKDSTRAGVRVVEATLPATGSLAVSWQRSLKPEAQEGPDAAAIEPRVYSEVHTLVGIGDGLLTATAIVNQTILFAGVDTMKVRIPGGMKVLDVRGNGVRDWKLDDSGVLEALLNYEAKGTYALTIDMERVLDGTGVQAPIVEPLGVERSKGWLGVQARGALEIRGQDAKGAAAVDVRTLPASILGVTDTPVLLGYKYLGQDAVIPLVVQEHEEVDVLVTLLDQAEATTMFTIDGRRLTSVRYQVRNNRRQFLRLKLPEGAELWSANVAGRAVQPAQSEGRLLVPLVRSQASGGALAAFDVEVVYVENGAGPDAGGKGTFRGTLPTADAPTTYVAWTVYVPEDAKVKEKSFDGSLRYAEYLSRPVRAETALQLDYQNAPVRQSAGVQASGGGLGEGAAPVQVTLPLDGQPWSFEKLLALDEPLWVEFTYKGLKD
ncbi:MAG: hypothetical protein KC656_04310 [Myxococcales bacterium]|nr:hypothetical protein [Myxococcales bacterium]